MLCITSWSFSRTAIILGTAIPLGLFLVWNAVILGSIQDVEMATKVIDPLEQLRSTNGIVGVSFLFSPQQIEMLFKMLSEIAYISFSP